MANEITIVETGLIRDYTVNNAHAFEKGSLMILSDPRTVSGATLSDPNRRYAGFAASEKVASDGSVNLGCLVQGVVKATASGAITVGSLVTGAESNKVAEIQEASVSGANVIGYSLETAANGETFEVRVDL